MSNPAIEDYYSSKYTNTASASAPPSYSSPFQISHPNEGHYVSSGVSASASANKPMSTSEAPSHPHQSHCTSSARVTTFDDDLYTAPKRNARGGGNPHRWFDGE